jgi:hypothetical protein
MGSGIACLFAGRSFIKNSFYKEKIRVTSVELVISIPSFWSSKQEVYDLAYISCMHYAGRENFTDHPLYTNTTDFTGLGVGEKQVQYLIEDGTIQFEYNNATHRFGKDVASWDAEDIIQRIEIFSGVDVHTRFESAEEKLMRELEEAGKIDSLN